MYLHTCAVSVRVTYRNIVPPRPRPLLELFLGADRKPWETMKALMTSSTIAHNLQQCHPTARSAEPAPRLGWCIAAVDAPLQPVFYNFIAPTHTHSTHTHTHTHSYKSEQRRLSKIYRKYQLKNTSHLSNNQCFFNYSISISPVRFNSQGCMTSSTAGSH